MNVRVSKEDILSLYVPFWSPGQSNAHARSVLICKQKNIPISEEKKKAVAEEEEETVFYSGKDPWDFSIENKNKWDFTSQNKEPLPESTESVIIDGITFSLVLSFNKEQVNLNSLLKFIILRYGSRAYGPRKVENSDYAVHSRLKSDDPTNKQVSQKIKDKLSDVDAKNYNDFNECKRMRYLEDDTENDIEWQWRVAGDTHINNEYYREMRNVNFIRGVYNIDIRNNASIFANDKQCRLVFDNHKILYSVLNLFKYPIEIEGRVQTIKVLDNPQKDSTRYELYDLSAPGASQRYIENQIRLLVTSERTMRFEEIMPYRGGLLLPSSCDYNDTTAFNFANTLEMMHEHRIRDDNIRKKDAPLPISYNRFYIDLENELHLKHVDYGTRRTILFKDIVSKAVTKKPGEKKTPDAKESNGSKPIKKIATLNRFFAVAPKQATTFVSEEKKRRTDDDDNIEKDIATKKFKFG